MVEQLTEEEIEHFKEAFALLDEDGDGQIPTEQLNIVVKALGLTLPDMEFEELYLAIDPEHNGAFDFDQFLKVMSVKLQDTDNKDQLREAFQVFDHEDNGGILAAELYFMTTTRGNKLTDEEAREMLNQVEVNADGEIKYEEYVEMFTSK